MQVGDKTSWERTFTKEDVIVFAQVSGDYGIHHLEEDAQGRVMIQGLLTATLPTKLGGDLNYIARVLTFEFLRPVFTGDTIHCDNIITSYEDVEGRINISARYTCVNQHGKEVLRGETNGVIFNPR